MKMMGEAMKTKCSCGVWFEFEITNPDILAHPAKCPKCGHTHRVMANYVTCGACGERMMDAGDEACPKCGEKVG